MEKALWDINRLLTMLFTSLSNAVLPLHNRHLLSLPLSALMKKDVTFKVGWLQGAQPTLGLARSTVWRER
jgi:hypothetical protein